MKQVSTVSVAVLAFLVMSLAAFGQTEFGQAEALAGGVTPGDTPGFPVTLSQPGSYKLTSNLDNIGANNAVVIEADDVYLDLAGFSIIGSNQGGYAGITISLSRQRTTVINGTVRDMGGYGLSLDQNVHVEKVMIVNNGSGMFFSSGRVVDCTISGNEGNGIHAALFPSSGLIRGNFIHSNGGRGIYQQMAGDGMIIDNHIVLNGGPGMELVGTGYGNNVLSYNNGGGAQVLGGVALSNNLCNGGPC